MKGEEEIQRRAGADRVGGKVLTSSQLLFQGLCFNCHLKAVDDRPVLTTCVLPKSVPQGLRVVSAAEYWGIFLQGNRYPDQYI